MNLRAVAFAFLLTFAFSSGYEESILKEYFEASRECIDKENVPPEDAMKIKKFEFPDEPIIRKFLFCTWTKINFWDDSKGFDLERNVQLHGERTSREEINSILTNCNSNEENSPLDIWFYRAFKCILESRLGEWFKSDIEDYIGSQPIPL